MMKIVHVITRLIRAGADENTVLSCIDQARRGYQVTLVHGSDFDPSYYAELPPLGINLVKIGALIRPVDPVSDLRALLRLKKVISDIRPNVVHTHTSKAGILGRVAALLARVPVIIHGVHIVPFANVRRAERLCYLTTERIAASFTHAFINVSRGVKDLYVDARVGHPARHHVIHSGFDLSRFRNAQPPSDWRSLLGLSPMMEKPPVVLMLAALERRKRHLELIEAFDRVIKKMPDVRLVLAGVGSQQEALQRRINELGHDQNIKLIGYRSDPERLIAMSDLCVLTSEHEGLPRVVMQYLAGGRTCVVSELQGIEEVIEHGRNGVVTSASDVTHAADAIVDLLANRQELERLTIAAAETDLAQWDADVMCSHIERVYQELSAEKHPTSDFASGIPCTKCQR